MKMYIVNSFTNKAFEGNPAAVCILDSEQTDEWMQQVASELNLSETSFLFKNGNEYALKWFAPTRKRIYAVMRH